jgi:hypothetical protein
VLVKRLEAIDSWNGTMAWHQRHRLGLLRARLALANGDVDGAAGLAGAVATDAARRGAGRYEALAHAVAGLADPSVPAEQLAPVVAALGRCAVLDGWPLVAALASTRRSSAWRTEAERLATVVVANAGDRAAETRRFVSDALSARPW